MFLIAKKYKEDFYKWLKRPELQSNLNEIKPLLLEK